MGRPAPLAGGEAGRMERWEVVGGAKSQGSTGHRGDQHKETRPGFVLVCAPGLTTDSPGLLHRWLQTVFRKASRGWTWSGAPCMPVPMRCAWTTGRVGTFRHARIHRSPRRLLWFVVHPVVALHLRPLRQHWPQTSCERHTTGAFSAPLACHSWRFVAPLLQWPGCALLPLPLLTRARPPYPRSAPAFCLFSRGLCLPGGRSEAGFCCDCRNLSAPGSLAFHSGADQSIWMEQAGGGSSRFLYSSVLPGRSPSVLAWLSPAVRRWSAEMLIPHNSVHRCRMHSPGAYRNYDRVRVRLVSLAQMA